MTRTHTNIPLLIAVGGGKGGVGKSVVSANLALALARLGMRVTAVDADLGSANLHTLFGLDRPGPTMHAWFSGEIEQLVEAVIPSGYPRLDLIPGSVAVPGAANLHHARKQKLIRHLVRLDADVVVIDCGAGIHYNVLDFFNLAHQRLLVVTPQLISLQNAYGFLKASVHRVLKAEASAQGKSELLENLFDGTETGTVRTLLERLEYADRALYESVLSVLDEQRVSLLGNQVAEARDTNALHAVSRMMQDFLSLKVPVVGALSRSERVHHSVTRRRPHLASESNDADAQALMRLAERLLESGTTGTLRAASIAPPAVEAGRPETAPALPAPLARYQRAHERHEVNWPAHLEIAGRRHRARIRDISRGGLKLELDENLVPDMRLRVVVEANGLPLDVRVVYAASGMAGCMFDPLPSPRMIDTLIERAARAHGLEAAPSV